MSYRLSAPPNPGRGAAGLARFPATPEAAPGCVEARTAGRRRSLGGRHEQPRRGTGGAVRFALEPGPPGLGPPTFDSFDCALAGRGAVIALVPGHRQRPATTRAEGRDADTGDGCMAQTHRWQGSGDGSKSLPRTARALGPAQAGTCRAATARHTATRARTCAQSARTRARARTQCTRTKREAARPPLQRQPRAGLGQPWSQSQGGTGLRKERSAGDPEARHATLIWRSVLQDVVVTDLKSRDARNIPSAKRRMLRRGRENSLSGAAKAVTSASAVPVWDECSCISLSDSQKGRE